MGEIFANDMTNTGLLSNTHKQFLKLTHHKNSSIKKWAEGLNRHFSKSKCRWPKGT